MLVSEYITCWPNGYGFGIPLSEYSNQGYNYLMDLFEQNWGIRYPKDPLISLLITKTPNYFLIELIFYEGKRCLIDNTIEDYKLITYLVNLTVDDKIIDKKFPFGIHYRYGVNVLLESDIWMNIVDSSMY